MSYIYLILIHPLELLFELIWVVCFHFTRNIPSTIICLSVFVNLLALPLYSSAEKLQNAEYEWQMKMKPWVDHIKKTFKGDERFMMLQTYYRQNDYKPVYMLRGSLPLLLQIPFFIAAYRFLSNFPLLNGVSLGPIRDLASPDSMFAIGGFTVNILPILMTLVNIISATVYSKGKPAKVRLQAYALGFVFLILLYTSPSGLVIYWLMNQVFSLIKNMVSATRSDTPESSQSPRYKTDNPVFFACCAFITAMTGLLIPSNVIRSSVSEFIDPGEFINPTVNILYVAALAAGTFIVWLAIYYLTLDDRGKLILLQVTVAGCMVAVTDYFFFGTDLGVLSSLLQYEDTPEFSIVQKAANIGVIIVAVLIIRFLFIRKASVLRTLIVSGTVAVVIIGCINTYKVNAEARSLSDRISVSDDEISLPLSRTGRNVVFLMLDRALETQVPYIMAERPELKEQFDGFTYYENTVSFGAFTNLGVPAVYGGYEYTPDRMNKREDELLAGKHNEALRVLPTLFSDEGWEVTVCDPPYAGYCNTPDLSIYDGIDNVNPCITEGQFGTVREMHREEEGIIRRRNFFCYSLMKISPLILQGYIYDGGRYNSTGFSLGSAYDHADIIQVVSDMSHSHGLSMRFLSWYSVLDALPEITKTEDEPVNSFILMSNCATHEPCLLQKPDYVPSPDVDNSMYDKDTSHTVNGRTMRIETDAQMVHYHANMAALLKLGEWFDSLRKGGVYDNTKIIIVADHGKDLGQFDIITDSGVDLESFMPLFMVKDYDAKGFKISDEFMTNADAAVAAVQGTIDDPRNPFSGNPLDGHEKEEAQVFVSASTDFDINTNNGTRFLPADWYTVHGNVYDPAAWEYAGYK